MTSAAMSAAEGDGGVAALKWLVGVMGVLIVAGTVTLVVLIVQRFGSAAAPAQTAEVVLRQPAGSRIGGIATAEGGHVAVWVVRPDGDRVLVVDPRSGRTSADIRLGD